MSPKRYGCGYIRNRLKSCDHRRWLCGMAANRLVLWSAVVRAFSIFGLVITAILSGMVLSSMVLGSAAQARHLSVNDVGPSSPQLAPSQAAIASHRQMPKPHQAFVRGKQIRVFSQQSNLEAGNSIYQAILEAALAEDAKMFGPTQIRYLPPPIRQDFAYQLLSEGGADIHHAGTSIWLEQQLRPIKVPLLGGGLGWRGMLVAAQRQQAIKQITQFSQLQHLTACQGSDWPDTQVLRAAGLKVWTADRYDVLIQALRDGRCDYFPRSIFEGYAEVRALQLLYPDLRFETKVLLQYPYATYFFVRPEHTHWQLRLTLALQRLAQRGELAQLWQQHAATAAVFPLQQYQSSLVFQLENPAVAAALPTEPYLWLQFPAQTRLISVAAPPPQ